MQPLSALSLTQDGPSGRIGEVGPAVGNCQSTAPAALLSNRPLPGGGSRMLWKLILLLTLVPLTELLILLRLTPLWGGFWVTVAVIIGTGVLGAALARREGLRVLASMREKLSRGELPTDSLIDGVLILIAAALLVTPGLMTDCVGFLLLIPPSRAAVRALLKRRFRARLRKDAAFFHGEAHFHPVEDEPPSGFPPLEDQDNG